MLIAVAGPYSAETSEQRTQNLDAMNRAAAGVMMRGHIPVIGVNAALPVVACLGAEADRYEAIMAISLALVDKCEALLLIAESPGATRECDVVRSKGLPIYRDCSSCGLESNSKNNLRIISWGMQSQLKERNNLRVGKV